jgi:hypothetical protein
MFGSQLATTILKGSETATVTVTGNVVVLLSSVSVVLVSAIILLVDVV